MTDDGFGEPGGSSEVPRMTPEQAAYLQGRRDALASVSQPRMTVFRVICGIVWGVIAVGFLVGSVLNAADGNLGACLIGLAIAGLAGWYDIRIWTLRARRLFLII
jgi:hypothetical protein